MNQNETRCCIQNRLLKWFEANARFMPWRETRDPYLIWISEIMLQQTRVSAVMPYYQRFTKRFPDIRSLAASPLDTVLKHWEGLGYYSRARNLHKAAREVCQSYSGQLPKTAERLQSLPGIGRYTAGAISSIAFNEPEPVLDGNVIRVLCRLFCIRENPNQTKTKNQLWDIMQELLPPRRPGDFNQAMMELGATVCLPKSPACESCPLVSLCHARRQNLQNDLPQKTPSKPLPHYSIAAAVIWKNGKILIDRRKPDGLLGGLWEFPGGKRKGRESLRNTAIREVKEELGIDIAVIRPLTRVNHAYSHFRITLHAFECRHISGRPRPIACDTCKWILPCDIPRFAFPKANHKIVEMIVSSTKS